MPRRPFPVIPRGPRRKRVVAATDRLLFGCPRVSPDWELGALRALMKPQTREAIAHRKAMQPWRRGTERVVEQARVDVAERIGFSIELKFPLEGDYFLVADVERATCEEAKGFALVLSTRLPELWFVLGRTFIKGARFYRRERGIKLNLVPATNVHLTRPIRAALRELILNHEGTKPQSTTRRSSPPASTKHSK